MKVRCAAQLLSNSVADALQYLSETNTKFKEAGPTIKFIRHVRMFHSVYSSLLWPFITAEQQDMS